MVLVPGRPYPEAHVVHEGIPEFVLTAITEQSIPGEHVVPSLLNTYPEEHFVPAIALKYFCFSRLSKKKLPNRK